MLALSIATLALVGAAYAIHELIKLNAALGEAFEGATFEVEEEATEELWLSDGEFYAGDRAALA